MSFLNELAERRLRGGPAGGLGAYDQVVRRKMTALERMTKQERRFIDAIAKDPDLAQENPQAAQALTDFQMAKHWGTTDERIEAQGNLWRSLVTAPGVRHTLSAVAWVGRQLERGDRAAATFLRGAHDSRALDIQARASFLDPEEYQRVREVLRAYDDAPELAGDMLESLSPRAQAFIKQIPEEYRPVIGMNPWERLTAGFSLDPQSLTIGEALITDEEAARSLGMFGLKVGHLRLPADIALSPLTWLTGSGAVSKALPRVLASSKDPARVLTSLRGSGYRIPVGKGSAARYRVLNEKGEEIASETYQMLVKKVKASYKTRREVRGRTYAGTTPQAELLEMEAERYAHQVALVGTSNRLGKMVDNGEDILSRGGLYFAPPFVKPIPLLRDAPVAALGRNVYQQIGRYVPNVKKAGDAFYDFFDRTFNELPFAARKHAGYASVKAQDRAMKATMFARLAKEIDNNFGRIPIEQQHAIIMYGSLRQSRIRSKEMIDDARKAIASEYQEILPVIDEHYLEPFGEIAVNNRTMTQGQLREGYFPQRYKNDNEVAWETVNAQLRTEGRLLPAMEGTVRKQTFQFQRQFNDILEAQEVGKRAGVDLEPVMNLTELLKIRAKEHVDSVTARWFEDTVTRRYGLPEAQVNSLAARQVLPDWEEKIEQAIGQGKVPPADELYQMERIGKQFRAFDSWRRGGPKAPTSGGIKQAFAKLSDEDKGIFIQGAMRILGRDNDLAGFSKFVDEFSKGMLDTVEGVPWQRAQQTINSKKAEVVDRFGQHLQQADPDGPFAGVYLPKGILEELRETNLVQLPRSMQKGLRLFDLFTDFAKWSLTAPWPSFHFRNAYSNVAQAFTEIGVSAFNPITHRQTLAIMRGTDDTIDILGESVPAAMERRLAETFGVIHQPGVTMDFIDSQGGMRKMLTGGNTSWLGKVVGSGSKLGQRVENEARVALWLHYRKQGFVPEQAAQAVNKVFFDYGSLSWTERNIMKKLFPFWTWNKKNIALQARQLKEHPGRWSAQVRASAELSNVDEDTGVSEAFLPEYALGTLRIGLGGDESKGRFLTGIDLPIDSALELAWPVDVQQTVRSWVSMFHPARSVFDAYGWQRDPFTGQDLGNDGRQTLQTMGSVVEAVGKALGPAGKNFLRFMDYDARVDPETGEVFRSVNAAKYHVFIKGSMLSRMASSTNRLKRYVDEEGFEPLQLMLDGLMGMRIREYDLTSQQTVLVQKNIKYLERLGMNVTHQLYQFPVTAISKRIEQ